MSDIVLIGAGGHCRSCIDVIEQEGKYNIVGIVDRPENINKKVLGYEIIACDEDLPLVASKFPFFLLAIGHVNSPASRINLYNSLIKLNITMPIIKSPYAYVSKHANIASGTIVMHNATINANVKIGKNCIINTGAILEHNVEIGNFCHISTGATINGETTIGNGCFIGSNAVCRERISLGNDVFIGCNERVSVNIPSNTVIK